MDIETIGLGAGSYPEAPEEKAKTINVIIKVEYKIKDLEIPEKWDSERIEEDIRENLNDYIQESTIEDWEVDF